jgi:hypothetical protein
MWDTIVQRTGEVSGFNANRGITRLLLGDAHGALDDFLEIRNGQPFMPISFVGATLWLQGQRVAACEDWVYEISRRRSGEITHSDDAGGVQVPVLLWWGSAHEGQGEWRGPAVKELKDRDRNMRRRKDHYPGPLRRWDRWPGVLAPFLLGTSTEEALLPHLEDPNPFMAVRRCPAHFYLGARRLDEGDLAGYRQQLELAVGQGDNSILAPEYHLARAELLAMDQG